MNALSPDAPALYRKEFFNAETSVGNGNVSFVGQGGGEPENGGDGGVIIKGIDGALQPGYLAYDLLSFKHTDIKLHFRIRGDSLLSTT